MAHKVICDYSKVDAYQYLDDNSDVDIVFNVKKFDDASWSQYLNIEMVANLFEPLLSLERFVVTVMDLDHEKVTQTHIIRYHIVMRECKKIFELRYYIQLYNWPAHLYMLDDSTFRNQIKIYSEMRNVSLSEISALEVVNDYPLLGFYKAVDSHVFVPEDIRYVLRIAPRLCSSCTYYGGNFYLPCAVNTVGAIEMSKVKFQCKDYNSKYVEC